MTITMRDAHVSFYVTAVSEEGQVVTMIAVDIQTGETLLNKTESDCVCNILDGGGIAEYKNVLNKENGINMRTATVYENLDPNFLGLNKSFFASWISQRSMSDLN